MLKKDIDMVRDDICTYCFDYCSHMKNSDDYHVCSLNKNKESDSECKVWEFLRWMYTKQLEGSEANE